MNILRFLSYPDSVKTMTIPIICNERVRVCVFCFSHLSNCRAALSLITTVSCFVFSVIEKLKMQTFILDVEGDTQNDFDPPL